MAALRDEFRADAERVEPEREPERFGEADFAVPPFELLLFERGLEEL